MTEDLGSRIVSLPMANSLDERSIELISAATLGDPGLGLAPLGREALHSMGLRSVGSDVQVDETVRVFGAQHVAIGSHVRIDCFAVITAGPERVSIGDHVHLGVGTCLFGTAGIEIGDFTSLSSRVSVYSTDDDYGGGRLSGPTVPLDFRSVHSSRVVLERHALVGAGSVILPGVRIAEEPLSGL